MCSELVLAVCAHEGIDLRCNHLDTTSVSLSDEYVPDSDEQAMRITHGYAKDHRPNVKQAVLELVVSHDGGVPLVSQSWDGNSSDTAMFRERAAALIATFQHSPTPRYLGADATRYTEANAANLHTLGCITRIPNTLNRVSPVITHAERWDAWPRLDDTTRYQRVEFCHDGLAQRWWVVSSEAAVQRAEATVSTALQREAAVIEKPLLHWVQVPRACSAVPCRVWSYCPALSPATASLLCLGLPGRDAATVRNLAGNHQAPYRGIWVRTQAIAHLPVN